MPPAPPDPQATAHFFGWRVVGAAFVLAFFAWGIGFYGPPIFLQQRQAQGWPVAEVSAAITVHYLCGALLVARFASLQRRFGLVAVIRAAGLLTLAGLLGWSLAAAPWQLYLAAPVSGAGWALTSSAALNAMVSPWFIRRRPAALGMAFNGASLGGVVFSPLWVGLIAGFGFPLAGLSVGVMVALAAWLLAGRYLRHSPQALGQQPDGGDVHLPQGRVAAADAAALGNPWRDRRFLTLTLAASLALFAQIGLVAQLASLLTPVLGGAGAGAAMGAATGCAILGRSLMGALLPPGADRRRMAAINAAVQAAGSLALLCAGPSVPLLLLGCVLFGFGIGNVTSLPPLIVQAEFRAADVPRVVALVTAIGQASYAFAPAVFGVAREMAGGSALFVMAIALQLAGAAVMLCGRRRN